MCQQVVVKPPIESRKMQSSENAIIDHNPILSLFSNKGIEEVTALDQMKKPDSSSDATVGGGGGLSQRLVNASHML